MNLRLLRKLVILVIGLTVILIGVVMIALPGPAIIVIPAGLAILATEFVWARTILNKMKQQATRVGAAFKGKKAEPFNDGKSVGQTEVKDSEPNS